MDGGNPVAGAPHIPPRLGPVSYTHLDVYKRQEESLSRLPELIRGADAVVCPTDRISHNAYYHVKAHCKRCLLYTSRCV